MYMHSCLLIQVDRLLEGLCRSYITSGQYDSLFSSTLDEKEAIKRLLGAPMKVGSVVAVIVDIKRAILTSVSATQGKKMADSDTPSTSKQSFEK